MKEMELWVNPLNYSYYYQGKLIFKLKGTFQDNFETETDSLKYLSSSNRLKKDILLQIQEANRNYVQRLQYEAENFIVNTVSQFRNRPILISFSGGKDSTVISHLVMSALGCSDILHIFADTTIELPDTIEYIDNYQKEHPITPFITVKSSLDFFKTAESIGPPSRIQRWCCSTHKTNPLAKLISGVSPHQGVLTFDGIRKAESSRRSSYPRISNHHKISGSGKQVMLNIVHPLQYRFCMLL